MSVTNLASAPNSGTFDAKMYVGVHGPALADGAHNGGEVVVGDHHDGRFLRHVAPRAAPWRPRYRPP
jgi:hypothetical protein